MKTGRQRKEIGPGVVLTVLLATLMASLLAPLPDSAAPSGGGLALADHHVSIPSGDGQQFVWPVAAWVAANHQYASGSHHSGSADLAVAHYTPVRPARAGTVVGRGWNDISGWYVRIEHGGTSTYTYHTFYGHLAAPPLVGKGDRVYAVSGGGTLLGYLSRTGNADFSGPHVHFAIRRTTNSTGETKTARIPGLNIGSWVRSGRYIPGVYSGLNAISTQPARRFDVRVTERKGLGLYATTQRKAADRLATLPAGAVVTVTSTSGGHYRVSYNGDTGWIPHSGTVPADSPVFGVRISTSYTSVNVRRSPNGEIIGRVAGGTRLTAFAESSSGWFRVQWRCTSETNRSSDTADRSRETGGCPTLEQRPQAVKYGWVGPAVAYRTSYFPTRVRLDSLNVYANKVVDGEDRPDTSNKIGDLAIRTQITVTGTRNGWYRFSHNGTKAWIRGWHTAGRQ